MVGLRGGSENPKERLGKWWQVKEKRKGGQEVARGVECLQVLYTSGPSFGGACDFYWLLALYGHPACTDCPPDASSCSNPPARCSGSINTRMDDVTAAKDVHGAGNPAITLYHRPLEEHASGGKRNNALNTHVSRPTTKNLPLASCESE